MAAGQMELTDKHFIDWEGEAFGYGYGTGEDYVIPAVKQFFDALDNGSYHYQKLEEALTPAVAWLLINRFLQMDLFEYGTSSRRAWLTSKGKTLAAYIGSHTAEELVSVLDYEDGYIHCYLDHCNCEAPCNNPMFAKE